MVSSLSDAKMNLDFDGFQNKIDLTDYRAMYILEDDGYALNMKCRLSFISVRFKSDRIISCCLRQPEDYE